MITSRSRIGANVSSSEVTMWTTRNAIASSETLRCTASSTNRGRLAVRRRRTLATPIATLSVSRTSAIVPVPRVRYQYALGPAAARVSITGCPRPGSGPARDDRGGCWLGGRRGRRLGRLLEPAPVARAARGRAAAGARGRLAGGGAGGRGGAAVERARCGDRDQARQRDRAGDHPSVYARDQVQPRIACGDGSGTHSDGPDDRTRAEARAKQPVRNR